MKNRQLQDPEDIRVPAPCEHRGCAMKPVELRARAAAALALEDDELTRVCDQDPLYAGVVRRPSPDFRSPRHVVEAKELTSEPLRRFNGTYEALRKKRPNRQNHIPVQSFRQLWAVSVEVSAAAALYDGDVEMPELPKLIETLIPMIEDLEYRELTDSFADHDGFERWTKVIGFYGHCAVLPGAKLEPGILLAGTNSGQPHPLNVDYGVVAPLQTWLDSHRVKNTQASLAGHPEVRVLVITASPIGPTSRLIHTLLQWPGEVPTAALRLPDGIDVLVIATNTDILRFAPDDGWRRHRVPHLQ